MSDNENEIDGVLRQSIVVFFAVLQRREELLSHSSKALKLLYDSWNRMIAPISREQEFVRLQKFHKISMMNHYFLKTAYDLEEVLKFHPIYKPDIMSTCFVAFSKKRSIFTIKGSRRWSRNSLKAELKFMFALLGILTGPGAKSFQSKGMYLSKDIILKEAFQCLLDYEEKYGSDVVTTFYHLTYIHFKSVNTESFNQPK